MRDEEKSREQLISELAEIRQSMAECVDAHAESFHPETNYCEILGKLSDAAYIIQGDSVKFANPACSELSGYSNEEILSTNVLDKWLHPDDRELVEGFYLRRLQGDITPHRYVFRIFCKDGSIKWVELKSRLIIWEGKPAGMGVMSDISDRKRAEETLIQSEQTLKTIVSTSPVGIAMFKNRKSVWLNDFAIRMSGYEEAEELVGKDSQMIYESGEEYDRIYKELYPVLNNGGIAETNTRIVKKDGSVRDVRLRIKLVDRELFGDFAIAVFLDITSELRAEREKISLQAQLFQSQKMEALGALVGGMAHDFNNMLYAVIGYSELLMDGLEENTPEHRYAMAIVKASEEQAELIRKLLAFAQQGQGIPVPLDINERIRNFATLMPATHGQMVRVDLDLDHRQMMIEADPNQMDQVLMNLAINACEAMPEGGTLCVSTRIVDLDEQFCRASCWAVMPGSYVVVSFRDSGKGMEQDILSKMFDPFFSTKQRGATRGTGLGLSVVRGVVKQRGGHATCISELGKGTELKIYLPVLESDARADESDVLPTSEKSSQTVLLVEDNLLILELQKQFLELEGYNVITALNGKEALEIFLRRSDEISLVILDLIMPEMSGKECLREMLKIDPLVRVLVVSGYNPEDQTIIEVLPHVKAFIHKPCSKHDLLSKVRYAIEAHGMAANESSVPYANS